MSVILSFPGQGAQQINMLHILPDAPEVKAVLAEAQQVLGQNLAEIDNAQALEHTGNVQLCLLIAGVASARLLIARSCAPKYVAGLSIGAYAAAVIAGALEFADALRLVALRGQLMQQAYPKGYGMAAVQGLTLEQLNTVLEPLQAQGQSLYLANINADNQLVVAGADIALTQLAQHITKTGWGRVCRLAVSVPSHCLLLEEAAEQLAAAFTSISIKRPTISYLSSSSARLLVDAEKIRHDLAYNMCRVVDWHGVLRAAYERGVRLHIELLPGNVLTGLARRVIPQAVNYAFQGTRLDSLTHLMLKAGAEN